MVPIAKDEDACPLCKENVDGPIIKGFKLWNLQPASLQHTLGVLRIVLKRHAETFPELRTAEVLELARIINLSQRMLDRAFRPDWYNIQLNGNWHRHLHFLVLPRYKRSRRFLGREYADGNFGEPIVYTKKLIDGETRRKLTAALAKCVD